MPGADTQVIGRNADAAVNKELTTGFARKAVETCRESSQTKLHRRFKCRRSEGYLTRALVGSFQHPILWPVFLFAAWSAHPSRALAESEEGFRPGSLTDCTDLTFCGGNRNSATRLRPFQSGIRLSCEVKTSSLARLHFRIREPSCGQRCQHVGMLRRPRFTVWQKVASQATRRIPRTSSVGPVIWHFLLVPSQWVFSNHKFRADWMGWKPTARCTQTRHNRRYCVGRPSQPRRRMPPRANGKEVAVWSRGSALSDSIDPSTCSPRTSVALLLLGCVSAYKKPASGGVTLTGFRLLSRLFVWKVCQRRHHSANARHSPASAPASTGFFTSR